MNAMTPQEFNALFPDITVGFNWGRFHAENWPVEHLTVSDREELLHFHTFFRYSLGRINGHFLHWLFMRQMPVGEVLHKLGRVPTRDRASIKHFAALYNAADQPVVLSMPSFALPGGGQYIMDGNHRLCGLALSEARFVLHLYVVHGPMSPDVLKDATHCR